jgi:DNA-binding NtrC family response regulator
MHTATINRAPSESTQGGSPGSTSFTLSKNGLDDIIGRSEIMQELYWKVELVAGNDIAVLLTGESGTGKELVARSIHKHSSRSSGFFLPINMGALAKDLVSNELFGHEKGAFTSASHRQDGLFEKAQTGSLFLDEIATMDISTQAALLRILENREFRKVGGNRTIKSNARIIAATNSNLRHLVDQGSFRKDLYYRLEVFTIHLPPLRNRKEDIPLLADHFISLFNRELGRQVHSIAPDALTYMMQYRWPGNIRELKNVMQRAMLFSNDKVITAKNIAEEVTGHDKEMDKKHLPMGLTLREVEKRYIKKTLKWFQGNKVQTARALGISRRALYNKLAAENPTGK